MLAFAGRVEDADALSAIFHGVFALREATMPLAVAIREAGRLLEQKVAQVIPGVLRWAALAGVHRRS